MPWERETFNKEGFENLIRFQGEVVHAMFKLGTIPGQTNQAVQLDLTMRVDRIEDPPDADIPSEYHLWFSIGDSKGKMWQIGDQNGSFLYTALPEPGFVKTSKMARLCNKCLELNAPMVYGDSQPWEARTWVGLNAIWQLEELLLPGLTDTTITLPVQILNAGAVPVQQQPVASANGNIAPPAASAPPPPPGMVQAQVAVPDFDVHWGEHAQVWKNYIVSILKGKSKEESKTIVMQDTNTRADSVFVQAIQDGSFWLYAEKVGMLKDTAGVLV